MWLYFIFLYAFNMLTPCSIGLRVIDVSEALIDHQGRPKNEIPNEKLQKDYLSMEDKGPNSNPSDNSISPNTETRKNANYRAKDCDDPKEKTLKDKIDRLVEQTIEDAERKMATIAEVKERGREQAPYRIGFILNMVKKSREVQNELFNVAVKHRDDWKSLEQMKIFELMVHTNVDTTNMVRQMVEIHVQHANLSHIPYERKRVVLLRRANDDTQKTEQDSIDLGLKKNMNKSPLTGRRWFNTPVNKNLNNDTEPLNSTNLSEGAKQSETSSTSAPIKN